KIVDLYPEPNTTTAGSVPWQNNYFLNENVTWYDFNNYAMRFDHNFGSRQRIYGRYVWNDQLLHQNSNGIPGYAADLRQGHKINKGAPAASRTTLTPATTLDIRASVTRWVQDYKPTNYGSYDATIIGWPKELVNSLPEKAQFPSFNMDTYKRL